MQKKISLKTPGDFMESWFKNDLLTPEENDIFKEYYKNYYKNFSQFLKNNYNERLKEVVDTIKSKNKKLTILDIGTGCGSEALYFSALGCNVLGIDLEQTRLNVAISRKKLLEKDLQENINCNFQLKSVFEIDPNKKFDLIWMMETFHHIEPREKFISTLSNLLTDNGIIVIAETNALNPLHQLLMIKLRGFKTIVKKIDANGKEHFYGKERILSAGKLKRLLAKNNIQCQQIKHFRIFPFKKIWVTNKKNKIISYLLKPFFVHYNYIGKKITTELKNNA